MKGSWLVVLLFAAAGSAHGQSKPNIVLVLMDNLVYGEVGVYGGGILRGAPTPRIDKPASEGLRLLNFNVEAQCTPRRAALVIGRYAIRTGNASPPRPSLLKNTCFWASKCRL
jgi:arylsulfatase A-like enzyme